MAEYAASYYINLNLRDKFIGALPGHRLAYVCTLVVEADSRDAAAEIAFDRTNRRDGFDTPEIDEAGSPSMSVGDLVLVVEMGSKVQSWHAVASMGFDRLSQADVDALTLIHEGYIPDLLAGSR